MSDPIDWASLNERCMYKKASGRNSRWNNRLVGLTAPNELVLFSYNIYISEALAEAAIS